MVEQGYLLLPVAEQCLGDRMLKRRSRRQPVLPTSGAALETRTSPPAPAPAGSRAHPTGQVERGLELLDEAMVAVSGGELSPI